MQTRIPPMDSSLHGSCPSECVWEVDIEELIAATKDYQDLCNSRHFYENIRGFPFTPKVLPPGVTRLWVKPHVGGPTLRAEADTQDYVRTEITKRGPPTSEGLYVPKVFDYAEFEIEGMIHSCIVMEFVTGTPISSIMKPTLWSRDMSESAKNEIVRPFKDRVAHALCFLLSLEPLPDTAPAPVNGGRIKNFVFGRDNCDGPCDFDTLEQLQEWINQENEKEKLNPDLTTADLVSEGLKLCYCDINFDNFLLEDPDDPASRLTIIDFEHTAWLPFSFLIWALWDKREVYIVEQVTSQTGMEIPRGNIEALHNVHLQRRWL
ncbi:hypothetical protein N8I77_012345 [Diaporthe amygdali]|uniref:Aminoglycoside phosphotransferase domain-containing protein n=1 Tax=Phomopsis amygdali TaxID=1214568 RepID=A0AAD9S2K8_PHOAM|nr:hypothetical protein N8I77_012345 [Diaporthe amygdali]